MNSELRQEIEPGAEIQALLAKIAQLTATVDTIKKRDAREFSALVDRITVLEVENAKLRVACKAWILAVEAENAYGQVWAVARGLTREALGR